MEKRTINLLFTGLGFLIGTVGIKAATSSTAKRGYVHALAQGMKGKAEYERIVEEAKAEFDDMKAEAEYIAVSDKEIKAAEKAAEKAAKAKKAEECIEEK